MNAMAKELDRFSLSSREFDTLARFINTRSGIRLPAVKKTMVEGRLRSRVRSLGFEDIGAYCNYLFKEDGLDAEADHIIDAVTTNKTDFFREIEHFQFLANVALPRLTAGGAFEGDPLRLWSCAASTGAEAYSLAMVLAEFATRVRALRYTVLGTDICREVLDTAAAAVYPEAMIAPVPEAMRKRYLMRSIDRTAAQVRIIPELRRHVRFARLNLVDTSYKLPEPVQIAFCRNVLIYFDREIQHKVLKRICDHIVPGGYLIVGHTETINGLPLPVRQVAPTVFERI